MHFLKCALLFSATVLVSASPLAEEHSLGKRSQFAEGEPIDDKGKGGPILGKSAFLPSRLRSSLTTL